MDGIDFSSKRSRYGYRKDVRKTYGHLPFQPFWTWVTGKSLWDGNPKLARETWLTEWQLWCQIAWSWAVTITSVTVGSAVYHSQLSLWAKVPVYIVVWVLVVNRTRGLLHTFHYTNHGASLADMKRAKWIGTFFMSIPILHTSWRNYHQLHAETHHSRHDLCTDRDPDQQFMTAHGFYRGMPEWDYWTRLVYAPLLPRNLWAHFWFRIEQNFIKPERKEIVFRAVYWAVFFTLAIRFQVGTELALFFFFPLILLTQHSSWIQHTTEHLWFPDCPEGTSPFVAIGALTWGRFLGRPHPGNGRGLNHAWKLVKWWALLFLIDIPIRIYSFMQDLPSHDFHHRAPRVNFWRIAQERSANEGLPSKYGPMTETWGIWESWLILRDHLCRGQHDPFNIYQWDRQHREAANLLLDERKRVA
ncbi:hypothetical protein [Massilia forsythiae]|uniref:hypothetical protein n=1 Tax=Massilia forsythiae TaxID=2728020 RepID=UPI001E3CDD29|nr:hypothetical protein [Massilia forsythiae]